MKNPFVSIIVPAYNEEKYIHSCLKSLLNQDYPRSCYEIILVDNNCSDQTPLIARKLKIRVIKEKKRGLIFALIGGINQARGEIIAIFNADCQAKPNWLSQIVSEYQKDPLVVGVSHPIDYRPKTILTILTLPITNAINIIFKIMPGCHLSFKKEAYLKVGGYSSKAGFSEDVYISKQLKKVGKIKIIPFPLATASSRRFTNLKTFLPYASKIIFSTLTITLFNRSYFLLAPSKKTPPPYPRPSQTKKSP